MYLHVGVVIKCMAFFTLLEANPSFIHQLSLVQCCMQEKKLERPSRNIMCCNDIVWTLFVGCGNWFA